MIKIIQLLDYTRRLKEFRVLDMRRRQDSKRSERKRNCEQCGAIPRSEGTGGARPSRRILSTMSRGGSKGQPTATKKLKSTENIAV